ncbi:dihydrofolate reductase [Arthrobacter sp. JSM 101049]|uniref:dihydrofolate reductase n=1 Tax=Arthrobacter sp. JSM 101049 TaxID=929097 RepID=UPI003569B565
MRRHAALDADQHTPGRRHAAPASAPAGDTAPTARIGMIWAQTVDGVIGHEGTMPWHLPEDMAHFKHTTMGHPVIMGRRTWASIPPRFRPFSGRTNIVLTSDTATADEAASAGAAVVQSLQEGLDAAASAEGSKEIWICGGGKVYAAYEPLADTAVVTVINIDAAGDTRAPRLPDDWKLALREPAEGWLTAANGTEYRHELWERR